MISFIRLVSLLGTFVRVQGVRYLGRVNSATKELTWSGTGVSFTFSGTSASIGLASVRGNNSAELIVDDGEPTVISNVAGISISTPAGLTLGNHSVVFRKRSEAGFGSIFIGDITTDGVFGPDIPLPERKIEVIGDSITVGYGIGGKIPCTNTAALEDVTKTYGVLAATSLKADYSIVAWSGRGIIRNYVSASPDDSPIMPTLYSRWGANDANGSYTFPSTWTPDAVVINLGTNDFGYLGTGANGSTYALRPKLDPRTYTTAMVQFVRSIETHYHNATFFLLNSPMLNDGYPSAADAQKTTQTNALKDAVTQLNGTRLHFIDWPSQGADVGCDYHPTPTTHAAEAVVLTAAIRTALGW
ncbi:carbohydrate esterase family 2 protein [Cucurbitaria berberidis CBS 394.84]|uniref:Carbohydrate esterase family 2 protein n=1 Tax=Cucurbitaria berberidis CBS 394.84 TaxID=1168544 RepID=A0A9P4LBZ3_9PLEO|nr:carbohydrate esterase family 2 protein [Cucurbitaria berberidis CBS 394.84]KAF1849143.1 carbohydrate esterase family 2 protein [Cucurbitaria berberidis CBS 394.84]